MITLKKQIEDQLEIVKEHIEMENCYTDASTFNKFLEDVDHLRELVSEQYKWNNL